MSIEDHDANSVSYRMFTDTLSRREFDILVMLGQGCSNREIAKNLEIAERTVKAHVTSVLAKLGLESRLQAGLFALSIGVSSFDHHHFEMPKGPMAGSAGSRKTLP